MDDGKVQDIQNWPVPQKIKDVQAFLGFANFYRRFIKDYSAITIPLTRLTHKTTPWNWTKECQNTSDTLKEAFTKAPVLTHWQPEEKLVLETNTSNYACAAVLSHLCPDSSLQPIAFHSLRGICRISGPSLTQLNSRSPFGQLIWSKRGIQPPKRSILTACMTKSARLSPPTLCVPIFATVLLKALSVRSSPSPMKEWLFGMMSTLSWMTWPFIETSASSITTIPSPAIFVTTYAVVTPDDVLIESSLELNTYTRARLSIQRGVPGCGRCVRR